jgi:hypothetical protein
MNSIGAIATLSIINFVCVIIIFSFMLLFFGRIIDIENSVQEFQNYRKNNEIQLNNLVNDVNATDKRIYGELTEHNIKHETNE